MEKYLVIIKTIVFLWVISVVIGHSDIEKRDVYRIILKDNSRKRNPRSHHHHHPRSHGHKHNHHHNFDSYEEYHGKYRKGKYSNREHDHSSEDSTNYQPESYESNSFERPMKYKDHHRHRHYYQNSREHPRDYRTKPKKYPVYKFSSIESEDGKIESNNGEWTPLVISSSETIAHSTTPHYISHNLLPPERRPSKEYNTYKSTVDIQLTTQYPINIPYHSSAYDTDSFNFFNQKATELKPFTVRYNNTYEVREEPQEDYATLPDSFQLLSPLLDFNVNSTKVKDWALKKQEKRNKGRKSVLRNRGRRIKVKN